VLIRAGDDIDRAADQRLQAFGAAREILDFDIETAIFEKAFTFRDGQWQIIEKRLAADAEDHFRLLRRALRKRRGHGERQGERRTDDFCEFHFSSRHS
jgi:hypothetical protein